MRVLKLRRVSYRDDGTFGVLMDEDAPFALTLERPWSDNEVGKSCIPVGIYLCRRVLSPKFGDTFEVTAVPGRTQILFHKGNIDDDSHGCILLGESFGVWGDGSVSISQSGVGFSEFLVRTGMETEFWLSISA